MGEGEQSERAAGAVPDLTAQNLTEKVRALYEDSAVPVREIARLAGVTERTLYKYVEKGAWRRRYICAPRDEAVARANRGRRWRRAEGHAPVKGAGGRFIRRADADKPVARGLKATDPEGRAAAAAACEKAARIAEAAQARAQRQAQELRHHERLLRAIDATNRALAGLRRHRARLGDEETTLLQAQIERTLIRTVELSLARWAPASGAG